MLLCGIIGNHKISFISLYESATNQIIYQKESPYSCLCSTIYHLHKRYEIDAIITNMQQNTILDQLGQLNIVLICDYFTALATYVNKQIDFPADFLFFDDDLYCKQDENNPFLVTGVLHSDFIVFKKKLYGMKITKEGLRNQSIQDFCKFVSAYMGFNEINRFFSISENNKDKDLQTHMLDNFLFNKAFRFFASIENSKEYIELLLKNVKKQNSLKQTAKELKNIYYHYLTQIILSGEVSNHTLIYHGCIQLDSSYIEKIKAEHNITILPINFEDLHTILMQGAIYYCLPHIQNIGDV